MPKKFQSIFFWFDGAFTDSIATLLVDALRPGVTGGERIALRQKFQILHQDLAIGKTNVTSFCQKAIETCDTQISPKQLTEQILTAAGLNKPLFDIYSQITPEHDPHIIVDIPEPWFQQLCTRWNVTSVFPADRLIFTEKFRLQKMLPDIFYFIPQAVDRNLEECLLVDPQQMRAVNAHRLGLASTAYVYPRRLKIDLALQGIWKTKEDIYHPKSSSRVMI